MAKEKKVDIITVGLINNFLYSVVDEMTQVVVRTTFSPIARDVFDFQCCFCMGNGEILLEGEGTLAHSMIYEVLINNWLKEHRDTTYPGDIVITNDPYSDAAHLPDMYIFRPIFVRNEIVGWACGGGHMRDVGGSTPGSCACDSTEIYQEGLRIPPMKLYEKGVPNDTLFKILRAASRVPDILIGDIESYCAACRIGESRFMELVKTYGWEDLKIYLDELLNYTERLTRAEIRAMPGGVYEFTDYLDDDGFTPNKPVPIHAKIIIEGDNITYDFSGTAPQAKGAVNNPIGTSRAIVMTSLRTMINPDIPRNGGAFRPIKLIVPEGTLLNPKLPAAVASRAVTIQRESDVILGVEAQIVPQKMMACDSGVDTLINIAGQDKDGKPFIVMETFWGGWGGRHNKDGVEFNTPPHQNGATTPCETNEDLFPLIMYNQFAYVPDTEGAGKYRGSLAVVRDWKYLGDEGIMQLRVDRRQFGPYGLCGGQPGTFLKATINPDSDNIDIGKITRTLKKGDVIRIQSAGAGGWGNPLERDINLVLEDVRNEKISVKRAKEVYGVVIDEAKLEVNVDETQRLREALKKGNAK